MLNVYSRGKIHVDMANYIHIWFNSMNFATKSMMGILQNGATQEHGFDETDTLTDLPKGIDKHFYFPNGTLGISSLAFVAEVKKWSTMYPEIKEIRHDNVLRSIRRCMAEVSSVPDSLNVDVSNGLTEYYDIVETTYKHSEQHTKVPVIYMSPDMVLLISIRYSFIISKLMIQTLKKYTTMINQLTGGNIPQVTAHNIMPGSSQHYERTIKEREAMETKYSGHHTVATIRRLWVTQKNKTVQDWDTEIYKNDLYNELYYACNKVGKRYLIKYPESRNGRAVRFYHIDVYKEVIKDLDYSVLER